MGKLRENECVVLGGSYENSIQLLLGLIAFSSLIVKRHWEYPQRPFKIWTLDVSKQCFGAAVAHIANLLISMILAGFAVNSEGVDQCSFYFINFFVDTTVGVVLIWVLLKSVTSHARHQGWKSLQQTGFYGNPPSLRVWRNQLLTWIAIVLLSKILLGIVLFVFRDSLAQFGAFLFQPLWNYPHLELLIVMIVCPCLMNVVQFWVQDSFLQRHKAECEEMSPLVFTHMSNRIIESKKATDMYEDL